MYLFILAVAPVVIIAFYIYIRDKYEKEPLKILLLSIIAGCISVIPILFLEEFLMIFESNFFGYANAFYNSFVVAAFSEELFKFLALYLLIWKSTEFNEKFDGIVYAVFVSLGFALVENVMYVFNNGAHVAYARAFTAVPAHALFGVSMGFHFGIAKFYSKKRHLHLVYALAVPIILHGVYDFILFSRHQIYFVIFLGYLIFLWYFGLRRLNRLSSVSIYNDKEATNKK